MAGTAVTIVGQSWEPDEMTALVDAGRAVLRSCAVGDVLRGPTDPRRVRVDGPYRLPEGDHPALRPAHDDDLAAE